MGSVTLWILIALAAALVVLVGASVATSRMEKTAASSSTWSGLWQSLLSAFSPLTQWVRVSTVRVGSRFGLYKDPARLQRATENRERVLHDRRVDKMVTDLAMLDSNTTESNISLEDFLTATQVEGPAYIDVVSPARVDELNGLYERYTSRK